MRLKAIADQLIAVLRQNNRPEPVAGLDDLQCLASDCVFEQDKDGQPMDAVKCLWFEIVERQADGKQWHGFRVIQISELRYLPQEARADPALIRKQASLLRGLYASGVEMITLNYGIFDPPLGVVQCYGAAARHDVLEVAIQMAESAHAAVIASLTAQYPQSRFVPLNVERGRWLWEALQKMPRVTALVGQPDPREGARGGGQQQTVSGPMGAGAGFSEQQNEILFRALARAKEEFLFVNIATPIARRNLAGMLESLANLTSPIASRQQGATSIGFGISLPVILSVGQAQTAGQSYGTTEGHGTSESIGVSRGTAHSEGVAESSGWSYTKGVAHTEGQSVTDSVTHSSGVAHSSGVSQSTSESFGTGQSQSVAHTDSVANTHGNSLTNGAFSSSTLGGSHSVSSGGSHSESVGGSHVASSGGSHTESLQGLSSSATVGIPGVATYSVSEGKTPTVGDTSSWGVSDGSSWGVSNGSTWGVSDGSSWANTTGSSQSSTVSQATTVGAADTVGASQSQNHTVGVSQGMSETIGRSESVSVGQAVTRSQAVSNSEAWSVSGGRTVSSSDTVSQSESASLGRSYSNGMSLGQALGAAQTQGLGAGVAPSVSISKSFQWKDEAAVALTQLLEQQLNILKEASEEGGFYSDVYMLARTASGQRIAEAAAVQAFGGSQGVVTHLQVRRPASQNEAQHLLRHVRTFTPSTLTESLGYLNGYAYSTVITPTQQAAYSAPGLFEEGTALTVQERTPPFAFVPDMKGDAVLGFLFSTERGELTNAPVKLSESRHFHTVFASDTGFGKTVAAERLAVEAVNQWHHRVVVLDFGAGWRRLVNGPLPDGRVDLYQLFPGAVRPFRWNFMQIGRRMDPDRQYAATAELIANAGRMGPRQLGYIKQAMWELYIEAGVMTTDKNVYTDSRWGQVNADELAELQKAQAERGRPSTSLRVGKATLGMSVLDLMPFERQALAVHRSKQVSIASLYARLKQHLDALIRSDQVARTSLEGILLRLEPFTHGELALMYGSSENTLAIEDLGLLGPEPNPADRWGLCVLEGGAEMDDYGKAVVLSLAAWHLYNDSVVRRRDTIGGFNRPLDIFFEEANKILSGAVNTIGGDASGGTSSRAAAIELWQQMWRDGRKYSIYLHPIVQTLSDLPPGIQSSCNNSFFGQMKNLADRDLAVGHLARSERGFTDEEYKRYMSRIPKALAIAKFGYSEDVADLEPMLARPLRVPGIEPTDVEIVERFGASRW
jgi:hypothetical protein